MPGLILSFVRPIMGNREIIKKPVVHYDIALALEDDRSRLQATLTKSV